MRRRIVSRVPLHFVVVAVLALAATPAGSPAAGAGEPAVQLGETRPLETALGDTTLPTAVDTWIDMIRGAKSWVDLEHFYLSRKPGEALDPVLDELGRASARGVKIRLILDAGMHRTYPQPADSLAKLANISVRTIDFHRIAGGVQHAKFMVVDDREAWLGSQNLDWRALSHIHELGARVRLEPVAKAFADVFETDWAACDTTRKAAARDRKPGKWPLAFTQDGEKGELWPSASPKPQSPPSLPWDRDVLVGRLNAAQHEIVAQFLSYGVGGAPGRAGSGNADSTLHRALLAAAARGVKVKLIVSDWVVGGRGEPDLRALAATPGIEVRISQVPEWSGGYIPFARVEHCKFMVADSSWLWLGTSNWEPSYFVATRNIAITVHHGPLARRARGIFETSWNAPSATALNAGVTLAKRVHGETPPPGATLYGE
jgi:phosphatidylserine/phosphatidylglycerophosphate/cardiolipin synthase-like enzyme